MKRYLTLLLTCMIFWSAQPADAHKIRIFAYAEGEMIIGEVAFSGGKQAKNVEIQVNRATDNELLATTRTDEQGQFSLPIPTAAKAQQAALLVTVDSGDGHSNSWLLEATDYIPGLKSAIPTPAEPVQPTQDIVQAQENSCEPIDPQVLQSIVDESIARQLSPVKELLLKNSERKITPQDIVGGIGYILGLAGLAAYLQARKGEKK